MNCKKATQLLSQKQDRALSRAERMSLKFHMLMCAACRHFDSNLMQLHKAFTAFNRDTKQPKSRDDDAAQ